AAWATTLSYGFCLLYILWYFMSKRSELKIDWAHFGLNLPIVKEIGALGFVTLSRQAVVSVTYLFMNNILYDLGGETSVTSYAIAGRMLMFAMFPVLGVTQGFLPITGFNYGAANYRRVRETINTAIKYAAILASVVFVVLMVFPESIAKMFTTDAEVLR